MIHNLDIQLNILIKLFLPINLHLTNVFLAWFDPICQQDCTAAVRSSAMLARDLLVGHDGLARLAPQEGRFFGEKQLKKSLLLLESVCEL
jgi:hypothetical protein